MSKKGSPFENWNLNFENTESETLNPKFLNQHEATEGPHLTP